MKKKKTKKKKRTQEQMAKKAFESSPYSYNSETLTYSRQLASSS